MRGSLSERSARLVRDQVDGSDVPQGPRERARLVAAATKPRAQHRTLLLAAAALVSMAAVLVLWLRPHPASSLTFEAGTEGLRGQIGAYFAPPGEAPLPLKFSDGSVVRLAPAARGRVTATTAHGAAVLLETGRAEVEVVHRPDTSWSVAAGPFHVAVTGTSFSIRWNPATELLEIEMHSGAVLVRGPGVEGGREVRGTDRFVSRAAAHAEADPAPSASASQKIDPSPPTSVSVGSLLAARPLDRRGDAQPAIAREIDLTNESWTSLAARGDYRGVLASAEERGIEATLGSSSSGDLGILADAARFNGRGDLARRALLATRSRFAGSPSAAFAAFQLGRMDDSSAGRSAIEWYDRYLEEAPGGPFASEAFGRRMVTLRRTGDSDGARRGAEEYVRRFPRGGYAKVAREILEP